MELILKIVKYIVLDENGEVNKSAVHKLKEVALWILIGMALMTGIVLCMDDEDDLEEDTMEQVDA